MNFEPKHLLYLASVFLSTLVGCSKDKTSPDMRGYPEEIGSIIIARCAVDGCHNTQSHENAYFLNLSSWDDLFTGSKGNSTVIPYRPDQSFLFYSINTFPDLGPVLPPGMPVNGQSLTKDEVLKFRDWIAQGAPDKSGYVKFSEHPERKKIYVINQGCDLITVFDEESKLVMRCIDVGSTDQIESPHDIIASPDGKSWFVSFYSGNFIQKFDAATDLKTGELQLNQISWHSMAISGNSKVGMAVHWEVNGTIEIFDPATMQEISIFGLEYFPHGCALNHDGTRAYVTAQQGNYITRIKLDNPQAPEFDYVILQPGEFPTPNGIYKPYEVDFSPDYSKYYVMCQGTNEVRIFNASNDSLIGIVPTTGVPQMISFSTKFPYAFVSCMEDSANGQTTSSVDVIDLNTNQEIKVIATGYQPRGLVVDDDNSCVWVANRNISAVGAAPHHTTSCGGRNGYITLIDMNTLTLISGWHTEVAVDPYSVTLRK